MHKFLVIIKPLQLSSHSVSQQSREQCVPLSFRCMQNTTRLKKKEKEEEILKKKACWTRHLDSCFRERGRGRETQGAGPTQRRSSQLRSREVTTASDKQSAIDHSSPRRSTGSGRQSRQTKRREKQESAQLKHICLPCSPLMMMPSDALLQLESR